MADTIGTAYIQIEPTTEGIGGAISGALDNEADKAGKSAGGKLSSALGSAAKVGVAAVAGASTAVAGFATASVQAGMSFDSAMSQVAATMGKSVDEIGNLRDFAQEMGSTTAFSATEAAEALNYMALAGYDADTSMKMLPNVLNLAAAGGMDLARASDMVTDSQSALGLTLDETNSMVDQMAKASSTTNTSVEQLGEAFLTIGATARDIKGGTEEMSTVLGILADNSIKGSEGGTHLRNMLLSLQNPTDKGAAALDKLGVAVYDSDGNMRSMIDIIGDLQNGLSGMSDESRSAILSGIFNKTDLAAVNALLNTSQERFTEVGNAVAGAAGAAQDMANTQLDNLSGDVTLFQSALEGAKIAVSDQLTPSLREFVQFGSDGLSKLTASFQEGGLSGAMETFGEILADGLNMIIEKLPDFVNAGMQLLGALGQGLLDNLPTITQAAGEILMEIVNGLIEALPQLVEGAIQIIGQLAAFLGEQLPELIPAVIDMVLAIVDALIDNIDLLIDGAIAIILGLAEGLINSLPKLIERLPEIIIAIVEGLIENLPKLLEAAVQIIISLATGLIGSLPELIARLPEIIAAIVEGLVACVGDIMEAGKELINGLWEGIKESWGKLVENVTELGSKLVDKVKGFFKIGSPSKLFADEIGKWIPEGIAIGIDANADSVDNAVSDMVEESLGISANIGTIAKDATTYDYAGASLAGNNNMEAYNLLAQYLPMLLQAIENSGVTLEGDAKEMFRMVRRENNQYRKANGVSALV